MEYKLLDLIKLISSPWLFRLTILLFTIEASWLALTTRFPMAFDEQYHFNLIQFFSHRLNPIVTSQVASTFKLGAIIHNPSFLYHYLLSFPYRFICLFTNSPEIQVLGLRFINVALAIASLLIMRRLLKLLNLSDGLINLVVLAFALTPIFTALSAQINYDNLLITLVSLCIYETVFFIKELDKKSFNFPRLLVLLCLCLFSSLVKFSFLPILLAILVIVASKIFVLCRKRGSLKPAIRTSLNLLSRPARWLLLSTLLLGCFLFIRFYGVNLIKYHAPTPQCNQILSLTDCKQYYAWYNNYIIQQQHSTRPTASPGSALEFSIYWLQHSTFQIFGEIMPLYGLYYLSLVFYLIVFAIGSLGIICIVAKLTKILQYNNTLLALIGLSIFYLLILWARNYHDYLQLGHTVAINGRYWLPILIYIYALMAVAIKQALWGTGLVRLTAKLSLSTLLVASLLIYGGFMQYNSQIIPVYGHLRPTDQFALP